MIKVDISNVWGSVEFADLMEIEKEVSAAHAALDVGTEEVKRYRGWRNLPARLTDAELSRMEETADRLRSQSEAVVVVGVGGASLGARAAIELLEKLDRTQGPALDHAAAIGDSENDFEMLRAVALPIAMGNASSEVKALCRWETDTNAEDGVAHAIDRILAHNKACDEQAENSGI